jgi:hypothetical protein
MILKQIEENEKEKVYKEEVREQENTAMFEYMQKLQEKDWQDFAKRKESQKKLAVKSYHHFLFLKQIFLLFFLARIIKS